MMDEHLITVGSREYRIALQSESTALINGRELPYDFANISLESYSLILDNVSTTVFVESIDLAEGQLRLRVNGRLYWLTVDDRRSLLRKSLLQNKQHRRESQVVRAPMPGLVVKVEVDVGAQVETGQGLVVLEAMKMENEIKSVQRGKVEAIHITSGKIVEKGEKLMTIVHE
ncbi:MAG: acetyl/propionyl-CoA carboxylase, alpha subunit [Bacteroidetes bacterium]|nr:acetyl/propionyl-CoA carboxylase, alpha subunit [Bacteroidota bacterium]